MIGKENIDGKNDDRTYKSIRIIDGKPKCVIVDENGKVINKYPSKEELKLVAKPRKYPTDICDRCGENFSSSGYGAHYKEKIEGKWTGKLICHKCYMKDRNNLPDSYNNRRKEFNRLIGNSKQRAENNCIKCDKILQDEGAFKHPMREYVNDKWTGHWLCHDCWYNIDYKNRPDTEANIIKSMRDRRTGNLHDLGNIFGDNCEELTKKLFGKKIKRRT